MIQNDVFPSNWLNSSDIQVDTIVTIRDMKLEEVGREPQSKPVMYFEGALKPLIVNVTNWKACAKLFGEDSDLWLGRQVTLYVRHDIEAFGDIVSGIRIRATAPAQPQAADVPDQAPVAESSPPDPVEPGQDILL